MLIFALASLLNASPLVLPHTASGPSPAAMSAGESWALALRPAVVVKAEDPGEPLGAPETPEANPLQPQDAPRLAPAKTMPSKAKARKTRPRAQASPGKR